MTYEEFLQLTEKNLKRFFPESFQERKVEIREVLKNNNIKLQGVYLSGSPSYTSVPLLYLESYYQELENGNKVAVEQCSLLCSQMLFLGKNGVLYGGVLGESEE